MKQKLLLGILLSTVLTNFTHANANERSSKDIERDNYRKGPEVVDLVALKPGMKVLDLLGGGGYYSELIAKQVGDSGVVYLHNNNAYLPYVKEQLATRFADNRLNNVVRYDKELNQINDASIKFDAVFFILGYHDIYHVAQGWKVDRDNMLEQLNTVLKPGGKLVIVDHAAKANSGTASSQDLHRIDKQYVINELNEIGFSLIKESDLLINPNDDHSLSPFEPEIRRKTDRFVLIFQKGK